MSYKPDQLGPFWLERQRDPESPDFTPETDSHPVNMTHRSWTLIGSLDGAERAAVDPRGLVTPNAGRWSLDWWIGGDDRWHMPSREATMRQRLVGKAPVVETLMRLPGGEAIHRAYGVRGTVAELTAGESEFGAGDLIALEIENRTPVPFTVVFALLPWGPDGVGAIESIELDGATVSIDGIPAIVFPRGPLRAVSSTAGLPDTADLVISGAAPEATAFQVSCEQGKASAAFLFPLAHTASMRVALSFGSRTRRPRRRGRNQTQSSTTTSPVLPSAEQVSKGWDAQVARGMRIEVPDVRLTAAIESARRSLLLFVAGDDPVSWPSEVPDWTEIAAVTGALDGFGFVDEVRRLFVDFEDHQTLNGYIGGRNGRMDAPGAALHALCQHWRLADDHELIGELIGPIAKAAHWIERQRTSRRVSRGDGGVEAEGMMPVGIQPHFAGGPCVSYRDAFWSLRGLRDAAAMLSGSGQPDAAEDAMAFANNLDEALRASFIAMRERTGGSVLPVGPGLHPGAGVAANLVAARLGVLPVELPVHGATVDHVRDHLMIGDGVFQGVDGAGMSPQLTIDLAIAELATGDRRVVDRIKWLLDVASPTWGWPEVIHPRTGDGSMGQGHHGPTTAGFLTLIRAMVIRDDPDSLKLFPYWPQSWLGESVEVHDAPTSHGYISFAVRWHGARPAVFWEFEPYPGRAPVEISVPGLDPSWRTVELSGDSLLAPVPVPPSPAN